MSSDAIVLRIGSLIWMQNAYLVPSLVTADGNETYAPQPVVSANIATLSPVMARCAMVMIVPLVHSGR
jgi:hypothetical protein